MEEPAVESTLDRMITLKVLGHQRPHADEVVARQEKENHPFWRKFLEIEDCLAMGTFLH